MRSCGCAQFTIRPSSSFFLLAFFRSVYYNTQEIKYAGMMELVDVTDSKSVGLTPVWVRVPLPAPKKQPPGCFFGAGSGARTGRRRSRNQHSGGVLVSPRESPTHQVKSALKHEQRRLLFLVRVFITDLVNDLGTKSKPSAAGSIWRGGAAERAHRRRKKAAAASDTELASTWCR